MNEKLTIAVEEYVRAKEAYFSNEEIEGDLEEYLERTKSAYNEAAHRVAFLVWLDTPLNEAMPIIPGIDTPAPDEWLDPVPDTEEDIKERAILTDMKKEEDASWYEAATAEELAGQVNDSRDYFDDEDYGEDDDWEEWPEQSLSTWVRVHATGHVTYFRGILSRYKGEDWGEASGWDEYEYELDDLKPGAKERIMAFVEGKAPGDYEPPFEAEIEEEESELSEDDDDDQDFDYTDKIYHGLDD